MTKVRIVVAWTLLTGALAVDLLAWFGVIAQNEPKFVLHLSTFALIYEGWNATQIAHKED